MQKSYDIFALKKIVQLIRDEKVDIINTHSGRDTLLAGIAGKLSARKPAVVRTRHLALPITSTFTYKYLSNKIVTVSSYVRNYLIREGIPESKITAVHTCVDLDRFNPDNVDATLRRELGLGHDTPVIGMVSILRRKKGHHILIEAMPEILRQIPEAVFVFAGNGPQEGNITGRLKELGLMDKVFMLGLRNDVPNILKSIDVFVLPTLQEALGTSFIEAMAMGKPVIGSDVGGVGELIQDGKNGYLIKPDDPAELAKVVIRTLKSDDRGKGLGMEGREIAVRNFSAEKMCKEMWKLYMSLLSRDN